MENTFYLSLLLPPILIRAIRFAVRTCFQRVLGFCIKLSNVSACWAFQMFTSLILDSFFYHTRFLACILGGYLCFLKQLANICKVLVNWKACRICYYINRTPYNLCSFSSFITPTPFIYHLLHSIALFVSSPSPLIINVCWGELWLKLYCRKRQIWDGYRPLCRRQ